MSNFQPILSHFSESSSIVYGCMGLGGGWNDEPVSDQDIAQCEAVIDVCLEHGINFFDHADIYTFGKAEAVFGEVLKRRPELREKMILQTKCGIRFADDAAGTVNRYDFSNEWIRHSVDQSLQRLHVDTIDILVLHRPDPLVNVKELNDTLNLLKQQGKVKHFGVSNMSGGQMQWLQSQLDEKLIVNQLEMSLAKHDFVNQGVTFNDAQGAQVNFPAGTVEFCQQHDIQIQSWGSLAQGLFSGRDVTGESQAIQDTANLVQQLAAEYGVSAEAILLSWLRAHPAQIQAVIGTTNLNRIQSCVEAEKMTLSREHWYKLFESVRGQQLP